MENYIVLTYRSDIDDIDDAVPGLLSWLIHADPAWDYEFYPEYGKKNCRLHWHGMIKCPDEDSQRLCKFIGKWKNGFFKRILQRADQDYGEYCNYNANYMKKEYSKNKVCINKEKFNDWFNKNLKTIKKRKNILDYL